MVVLKKLEFCTDYDFEDEGEDEAMFQEYRKTLKVLFCSIAKMVSYYPVECCMMIFCLKSPWSDVTLVVGSVTYTDDHTPIPR